MHYNWDTEGPPTSSSKRSSNHIETEQLYWLKLSQLYRDLGEYDIVAGIFSDKLLVNEQIPLALQMEQRSQYEGAKDIYESVIGRANAIEKDFSYESYFLLLELMGDWQSLQTNCHNQLDTIDDVWTDTWNLECLLPYIMRAELRCILAKDPRGRTFLETLEQWVRVPDKSSYLTINFGEEMLMLQIANKDYHKARVYAEQHLSGFLADWQNLNVLSHKVRISKLLANRTVAEIYGYTDMLLTGADSGSHQQQLRVEELLKRWNSARPQLTDSTRLWDSILTYRQFIGDQLTAFSGISFTNSIVAAKMQLLDVALGQGNMSLSKRLIDQLRRIVPSMDLAVATSRQQSMKAMRATSATPIEGRLKTHLRAWKRLEIEVLRRDSGVDPILSSRALEEISAIAMRMLPNIIAEETISNDIEIGIRELTANESGPLDVSLIQHSLLCMQKCVDLVENFLDTSAVSLSSVGETSQLISENYFKFAEYCQQPIAERIVDIEQTMIVAVLRAIQYGSVPARLFFPRILELPKLHVDESLKTTFNREIAEVPEWMFLRWVPQMLSTLSLEEPSFLDGILLRMATTYPAAMLYPFRLKVQCQLRPSRSFIDQIGQLVRNPSTDLFIGALVQLGVPEKNLIFHLTTWLHENAEQKQFRHSDLVRRTKQIVDMFWPNTDDGGIVGKGYERLEPFRVAILAVQPLVGESLLLYVNLLVSSVIYRDRCSKCYQNVIRYASVNNITD